MTQTLEQTAFADRMLSILEGGALSMMISIGHRTGLFDALHLRGSTTAKGLAEASGLQERYVREWLGAMVAGCIVEYSPITRQYRLPETHAAFLCRRAPDSMAATMQWVSVLGGVEDRIVECFRTGGGVPYESFARFHEVMAEESAATVVEALEDSILPLEPGLAERLDAGLEVLDLGCGSGRALCHLAATFPRSSFVGYDFSEEAIGRARDEAGRLGLRNVTFEVQDAARVADEARFDLVLAFDSIHDQAAPAKVLANIHRALKPDGLFLMQDIKASSDVEKNIEHPLGAFLYTISTMHCMTVSLACCGDGLGTCWGRETAQRMLHEAGFGGVEVRELEHDILNDYYLCRR